MVRLAELIEHPNKILASYSCATIERFFFVKGPDQKPVITREGITPFIGNLLKPLCMLLQSQQNLYAIKALYRLLLTAGSNIVQYSESLSAMLSQFLKSTIEQPANQSYNYMLFECIGISIKLTKDSPMLMLFEKELSPVLLVIIEKNVLELISYAFQVLSTFVLYASELNSNYMVCFGVMLAAHEKHCDLQGELEQQYEVFDPRNHTVYKGIHNQV